MLASMGAEQEENDDALHQLVAVELEVRMVGTVIEQSPDET